MRLLILGGTLFVGRHLTEAALARGHAVTLFNRGRRNPGLFPGVEAIVGDRESDLERLSGRTWDAVIDTCGYLPRLVRASAEALAGRVGRYVFISTISVYAEGRPGLAEGDPLGTLEDPGVEGVDHDTYGPLKALCEHAVREVYPDAHLIVRPGIIAGPHDPTDRFTYWAARMADGGSALVPAPQDVPVQAIDARDLADWTLRMVEAGQAGIYNACGPEMPMASFLDALRPPDVATELVWVDPEKLRPHVEELDETFPLWTEPEDRGYFMASAARALDAGLTLRSLAETAADTRQWLASEPARPLKNVLTAEAEAKLLSTLGLGT